MGIGDEEEYGVSRNPTLYGRLFLQMYELVNVPFLRWKPLFTLKSDGSTVHCVL